MKKFLHLLVAAALATTVAFGGNVMAQNSSEENTTELYFSFKSSPNNLRFHSTYKKPSWDSSRATAS